MQDPNRKGSAKIFTYISSLIDRHPYHAISDNDCIEVDTVPQVDLNQTLADTASQEDLK